LTFSSSSGHLILNFYFCQSLQLKGFHLPTGGESGQRPGEEPGPGLCHVRPEQEARQALAPASVSLPTLPFSLLPGIFFIVVSSGYFTQFPSCYYFSSLYRFFVCFLIMSFLPFNFRVGIFSRFSDGIFSRFWCYFSQFLVLFSISFPTVSSARFTVVFSTIFLGLFSARLLGLFSPSCLVVLSASFRVFQPVLECFSWIFWWYE
jgi:hypothetical protein